MTFLNLRSLIGAAAMALVATAANADTILPTNAMWTVTGGNSNLVVGNTYQGTFGYSSDSLYSYNTLWAPGSGVAPSYLNLRTTIDLSGYDLSTVQYSFAIDNDISIYVNNTLITSLIHEGAASWTNWATLGNTFSGVNQIDVVAVDRGGAAFFGLQVKGTPKVPDTGSALALLSVGLVAVAGLRRRLTRA